MGKTRYMMERWNKNGNGAGHTLWREVELGMWLQ